MKKQSNQKYKEIYDILDSLDIPFCGTSVSTSKRRYYISPFKQISISGVGPIFFCNKRDKRVYTVLQRRYQDNFQWLIPGGYVEIPSENDFLDKAKNLNAFAKLKKITLKNIHQIKSDPEFWQNIKKDFDDPDGIKKTLLKHKIKWPRHLDINLQSAWQREVLEETGIDLDKFIRKIVVQLPTHKTLFLGAEPDRLTNIDNGFAANLGELDEIPEVTGDKETQEVRWVAIDDISFSRKHKNYHFGKYTINPYTLSFIETALYLIICKQIEENSKLINPSTRQEISRFNTPQNLQSFLIDKLSSLKVDNKANIEYFLSWKFGALDIGTKLCSKDGSRLYNLSNSISKFIKSHDIKGPKDLHNLEKSLF